MTRRLAIAQIKMHWTTEENVAAIHEALAVASARGAELCGFAELAITGFHRHIARESQPEKLFTTLQGLRVRAAELSIGVAVGVPYIRRRRLNIQFAPAHR